jgi:hypothetical protein
MGPRVWWKTIREIVTLEAHILKSTPYSDCSYSKGNGALNSRIFQFFFIFWQRMHRAFDCGLMTYGMIKAKKIA